VQGIGVRQGVPPEPRLRVRHLLAPHPPAMISPSCAVLASARQPLLPYATPRRADRSLAAPTEDRPDGVVGTGDDVEAGSRAGRPPPARGRLHFPGVPRGPAGQDLRHDLAGPSSRSAETRGRAGVRGSFAVLASRTGALAGPPAVGRLTPALLPPRVSPASEDRRVGKGGSSRKVRSSQASAGAPRTCSPVRRRSLPSTRRASSSTATRNRRRAGRRPGLASPAAEASADEARRATGDRG